MDLTAHRTLYAFHKEQKQTTISHCSEHISKLMHFTTFSCCLSLYTGQGCSRSPCGVNAMCQETLGGRPVCSCPAGHSGNPLSYCRRAECLDHTECRGDMACRNGNCVNPCAGTCGANANCEVRNHVPVCSCPVGYNGDPFSNCRLADPGESDI